MRAGRMFVESTRSYDREHLPAWYTRPVPEVARQRCLFAPEPEEIEDVLAALRISVDDLARWHGRGWVSFNLEINERIEEEHVNELRFIRDVVRSGLSDAHVEAMLAELPRPMNFDPAQVAYSFSLGWVQAVSMSEPDVSEFVEEHLHEWLRELAESDPDRLAALRIEVDEAIVSGATDDGEGASEGDTAEDAK